MIPDHLTTTVEMEDKRLQDRIFINKLIKFLIYDSTFFLYIR